LNAYVIPGLKADIDTIALGVPAECPDDVLELVARCWGITSGELTGYCRRGDVPLARHMAVYIMRKKFGMKADECARRVGKRCHATVLNSMRVARDLYDTHKGFREKMIEIL